MSSNAFPRLEREYNEREEAIERAKEESETLGTKDWRFRVSGAADGVWLHSGTGHAVASFCALLQPHEAERLSRLLAYYSARCA